MIKVYCAGKISKNDWRHKIAPHLRGSEAWGDPEYGYNMPSLNYSEEARVDNVHVADYVGPFFLSCDHGCMHGKASHGTSADTGDIPCMPDYKTPSRSSVQRAAFNGIQSCDWMFVWMCKNFTTAYGTHVEVGYAKALGKKIAYAAETGVKPDEHWFLTCNTMDIGCFSTAEEAWNQFINATVNGIIPPTAKQLSYARLLLNKKKLPEPQGLSADRNVAGRVIGEHAPKNGK